MHMEFTLSQEQTLLRKRVIEFARSELNDRVVERDDREEFPRNLWLRCGEFGLQGLPVPAEFGGTGLDPLTTAMALEAFGYGCTDGGLVFSVCAHLLACVVPIWKHGNEEQRRRYLPDLCNGSRIAVNAITETTSGSDAFNMKTRAERVADGFRITGTKTFSSNGPIADVALVYGVTDDTKGTLGNVSAFVVEKGTPGFDAGQTFEKMGLRTAPIGELVFDDCLVAPDALLGKEGAGYFIFTQSMDWERTCIAATHVGTMQRILETAADYARTRSAFGKRIASFQAVSHRLADMKVRLEAARLLVYRAAAKLDRSREATMDASIAKLFVSEALVKSSLDAVQVLGGYGYMKEYHVERAVRDAVASTLYSGTSEMQRNIIAGWLGL
jgi:hypothetical protein